MAKFNSFEEIVAWQKARELNVKIYKITNQNKFAKDYGLRDQLRRSIISVSSNIAKASIGEVRSQLYLSVDLNYISQETFEELFENSTDISKMLSGLIKYLINLDN